MLPKDSTHFYLMSKFEYAFPCFVAILLVNYFIAIF